MKKRILALVCASLMVFMAAGCGSSSSASTSAPAASAPAASAPAETPAETEKVTVGISQFAEHGSLDNCRNGFIQGLADEGFVEGENLTIIYENSQADTGTSGQIANDFVSKKADLICGIATPAAAAAYAATMKTDIPVVFSAVTDPIAAGFANEDGTPVGNITGTSDKLPVEQQLAMIREILPEAKTLGIMFTTSEVNSESAIKEYEALVGDYGFELVTVGINTTADIPLAADNLLSKVDCVTNLTDNTVVQGMATMINKANEKNIPVFGSEVEQVKNGCLAAAGLEYIDLGVQTGHMAGKILKGEAASEMPFELITECGIYINTAVAENLGVALDADYVANAVETYDSIAQ